MLLEDLVNKFLNREEYKNFSLTKLEKVDEKYNCIITETTKFSKNGYYRYSGIQCEDELSAIESAIRNTIKTGSMTEIELPQTKKESKKNKVNKEYNSINEVERDLIIEEFNTNAQE